MTQILRAWFRILRARRGPRSCPSAIHHHSIMQAIYNLTSLLLEQARQEGVHQTAKRTEKQRQRERQCLPHVLQVALIHTLQMGY